VPNLIAKKLNVSQINCPCGSVMMLNTDWEKRVYAECTDITCPMYGKQYEVPQPWDEIVLSMYVPNPEPEVEAEERPHKQ